MIKIKIALIGTPNSGKTSLFNLLTSQNQKVGNRAGVTVEIKSASLRSKYSKNKSTVIFDLPGIYSLDEPTAEQKTAYKFIEKDEYDYIINVLDSTDIERGLHLTYSLCRLGKPMIVVLTMADELKDEFDIDKFSRSIGAKAILISVKRNIGISTLTAALSSPSCFNIPRPNKKYSNKNTSKPSLAPPDKILLGKFSLAIMLFILAALFILTFTGLSLKLSELLTSSTETLRDFINYRLCEYNVSPILRSLICRGIFNGVCGVLGFLPQICVLFLLLAFLEDIGYMSRISLIGQRFFGKIGIGGNALVSVISSFGCTVPGVLGTRTIENEKKRKQLCVLLPVLPCSARLPVIMMVCSAFFGRNYLIIAGIYIISIFVFTLTLYIISKKNKDGSFYCELPKYRVPSLKNIWRNVTLRVSSFIKKAFTAVLLSSVAVWFLSYFNFSLKHTPSPDESMLAIIGDFIAPVFRPLGFGNWQSCAALISGLGAKENIVSTFEVLCRTNSSLAESLITGGVFTQASALSFIVFCALYSPCAATASAIYRETGSRKLLLYSYIFCFTAAYICSFIVFRIAI